MTYDREIQYQKEIKKLQEELQKLKDRLDISEFERKRLDRNNSK